MEVYRVGIDPELDAVFNAALTGICANPAFFGPIHQGSPVAAVEFASSVVFAIWTATPSDKEGGE